MVTWRRELTIIFGITLVAFLVLVFWLKMDKMDKSEHENHFIGGEKTFYELATEVGTDKVNNHHYDCLYEESLAPYRHKRRVKLLEIGLGCNMNYGAGASYFLWTSYFFDVQVYFLEYDQECGEKWLEDLKSHPDVLSGKLKLPIMTYGDQADRSLLQTMAKEVGPWDIIVDDGGHKMSQMINSFQELFPHLSPHGIYFIEDIQCSLDKKYEGVPNGVSSGEKTTAIYMIAETFAQSTTKKKGLGANLERLTCCDAICGLRTTPRAS